MTTNTTSNTSPAARTVSDETILKISKEITVKFIEMGRVTPTTFSDTFKDIHSTIKETLDND